MENVIITGADGFVGSYTVENFLSKGIRVTAIDIGLFPNRLQEHPFLTYLQCDVADTERLVKLLEHRSYEVFIHFAWAGSSGEGRFDYNLQLQNALTTVECLKVAKFLGCKRFICAGSIMEYEAEVAMHTQGSKPGMGYIYGMGKHAAHGICKSVAANIGIDLLWPMITNAYGIGELSPRFVNTTLRKIIKGEPLKFTSATQNYDFVYVSDVAEAFFLVAEKGKPFCEYMIGSGKAQPLKGFIQDMIRSCSPTSKPLFGDIPFTGTNMPLSVFSNEALHKDCDFIPRISFEEGTRITMEWLKTH